MRRRTVLLLLTIIIPAVLAAGCSYTANNRTNSAGIYGKKLRIVIMPKVVGIPYFNATAVGAKTAGDDLGCEVIYTGPTKADAAEQVKMLEDLISKGVDCIAVSPNDPAALTPVLKKAREKGIFVMDWDAPAEKNAVELSVHQIDDRLYAEHIWDLLADSIGTDDAQYAIITGGLSAANMNTWIGMGLAYAREKYPRLKLVTDKVPSDEKQQVAYQRALELIKAYPDLKGIIGISSPAPLGAAQAVQEKGLQNSIAVVGTSLPTDSKKYLQDGSLDATTLWDPVKLGYLTIYLAHQRLKGQALEDGQEVPKVGKIKVLPDKKTVIMGAPMDFTSENVDLYKF